MLTNFIVALVERILNTSLKLDTSLIDKLEPVSHKRLLIDIRDWQQQFVLVFTKQSIHLHRTNEQQFDCMISGDIETLLALKNPAMLTQLIRQDKLDLQGDLNIAQGFSNAFSAMDIDWPEHLSRYLGDAPAQQLWQIMQSAKHQGLVTDNKVTATLTQLCQDELKVTIHPLELDQFKQQTRQLKGQVAQLEQRINQLLQIH
ncbi:MULTISPECIES: SCP2 sterol-binding domain-containing protein [unclassified Pseudoalteromonas]|uniref:ubiquinone biosynthesis accessory factor UbiJ n=1 Tax=unclassified Pseudoalteromonas TaxID=194690 RepID=UPI0025B40D0E|nr:MULTISPECIES: SCP2 sterol-binding domain-containing protein [unclassified Pseudoalteromonas]MDN3378757.1 SCP2 sterol-binding domain-containing protein [Pseudoalteromonas sp. APC 3893]MDN3387245.1 SCP2 sterol-binding domain-containing protein [Pseudoalteromonas sp. APC 4017]